MSRPRMLRIFAKGNVDVRDSLLWSRVSGKLEWNGLNQALRERGHRAIARIKHETAVGFDFIPLPSETATNGGNLPRSVLESFPPDPMHPLQEQHQSSLFSAPCDLVVLSLQPDAIHSRIVHKESRTQLLSPDAASWSHAQRTWLAAEFESGGSASLEGTMARLARLLDAIEEKLAAPVLVYNLCPLLPHERVHSYLGAPDALAIRIRRFNLALAELSTRRGFSIVDLERISAAAGADRVKVDILHFTAAGWRLIAEEVVRILEARGILSEPKAAPGAAR